MNDNKNLTNEQRISALEKAREMSRPQRPDGYQAFLNKAETIATLEDEKTIKKFIASIEEITQSLDKQAQGLDDAKLYSAISKLTNDITRNARIAENNTKDWEKVAKSTNKISENLNKAVDSLRLDSRTRARIQKMLDTYKDFIETSESAFETMKQKSETLAQTIDNGIASFGQSVMKFSNFLNLNKLVTGGVSSSDLRNMQHGVKVDLGINTNQFMQLQGDLVDTNRRIGDELGLSFKDTVNYLSSIKDYSFKNYNQAVALYKQVSVGTKYLSLTSSNISSLTRAANQLADNSYMDRQLALLSALGSNSAVAEDYGNLADFIGNNSSKVAARYGNYNSMMTDAVVIKSVSDALFGNNSSLVENLMTEIMGSSDFSQLSESTRLLLSYTGMTGTTWQQMRNGNVDYNTIVSGVLNGTSGLNRYQMTTLENLGLGEWVTMGGNFNRNSDEYYKLLEEQYGVLGNIDLSTEEGRKQAEQLLANQNDDRTFFEKSTNWIMNAIGIQNQNWTALLGVVQTLQLVANGLALYSTVKQSTLLKLILASINGKSVSSKIDSVLGSRFGGTGSALTSMFVKGGALRAGGLYAGGASTAIAATAAVGGAIAGGAMMYNDYQENGWKGAFLGNGDFDEKSTWQSIGDIAGNMGKYAAIGAAVGTIIPGVGTLLGAGVGALVGVGTGLIGGLVGNKKAVEDNTDAVIDTKDSIYSNSALRYMYKLNSQDSGGVGSGVVYGTGGGVGGSSDATADYPWTVSSPYGPRDPVYDDKGNLVSQGFHHGVDLAVAEGTKIGAAMAGKVVAAGMAGSAGNQTVIYGDNGKYYRYFHQKTTPPVTPGMRVEAGDVIGYVGTTGASTGPHLHFQVDNGGNQSSVAPYPYITGGLFKADGKEWHNPLSATVAGVSANGVSATNGNAVYSISKESVFGMGAKGGAKSEDVSSSEIAKYATSADIDRLIKVIQDVQSEQTDQRQFMQALAGKNTFVYGRS